MAASYPSSAKSFSTKTDGAGQTIFAAHVNDLQDEVVAIETALVTNGVAHVLKPSVAGAQDLGTSSLPWGNLFANGIKLTDATTLTLATDAATVIHSYHALDTEGAAAADNCATLTAGAGVTAGFIVIVRAANVAHVVTMKDGTGNLLLNSDYDLSTTDATMMLIYDGTNWRELARSIATVNNVRLLDKSTTEQSVDTTNAPVSVYSFSVPGATLGSNKTLKLTITGEYQNTSGGNSTLSVTGVYGATTFCSGSLTNFGTGTTGGFELVIHLNANGATNSQRAVSAVRMVPTTAAPGNGVFTASGLLNLCSHNALAEDSTAAKTLSVSVTHSVSASTIKFKRFTAILELIG